MRWILRTFGRSFVWKLGAMAALVVVGALSKCYAQTIECASACTITLVHTNTGPFHMSVADGAALGGLIVSVWVSAFIVRALIRTVRDKGTDD